MPAVLAYAANNHAVPMRPSGNAARAHVAAALAHAASDHTAPTRPSGNTSAARALVGAVLDVSDEPVEQRAAARDHAAPTRPSGNTPLLVPHLAAVLAYAASDQLDAFTQHERDADWRPSAVAMTQKPVIRDLRRRRWQEDQQRTGVRQDKPG